MFSLFLYSEGLSGSLVQEPFQLATEKRAKERQELEKKMAEAEAQRAQQLEEARQQEEEQQRKELARLRKELVTGSGSADQPTVVPVLFYLHFILVQKESKVTIRTHPRGVGAGNPTNRGW